MDEAVALTSCEKDFMLSKPGHLNSPDNLLTRCFAVKLDEPCTLGLLFERTIR